MKLAGRREMIEVYSHGNTTAPVSSRFFTSKYRVSRHVPSTDRQNQRVTRTQRYLPTEYAMQEFNVRTEQKLSRQKGIRKDGKKRQLRNERYVNYATLCISTSCRTAISN